MAFNYQEALKQGASEDQVLDYLNKTRGYDVQGAIGAGASKAQVIDYLSKTEATVGQTAPTEQPQQQKSFFGGVLRDIPSIVGSTAGEFVGGPVGSGIGAAGGETVAQGLENLAGTRQGLDVNAIKNAGILGTVIPVGFKVAAPLLRVGGKLLGGALGALNPLSKEAGQIIAKHPNEVEQLAKEGAPTIAPIVEKVQNAQKTILSNANKDLSAAKKAFSDSGKVFNFNTNSAIKNVDKSLSEKFQLGVGKDGTFHSTTGGPLGIGKSERNLLENALETIKNTKINSPEDLAKLKQQLRTDANTIFPGPNEVGSKRGVAIFQNIISTLDNAVPKELQEANKAYSARLKLVEQIQNNLIPETSTGILSPSSLNKIRNAGKEELQGIYRDLLQGIQKETGLDLGKEVGIFNAVKEITPSTAPGSLPSSNILEMLGRVIQRGTNPAAGQIAIEKAKALQGLKLGPEASNFLNLIKEGSQKFGQALTPAKKPAAKAATFEATRKLLGF